MAVTVKHKFQSGKSDGGDASLVRPSNWNDDHNITMDGERLLGRSSAGNGTAQELSLGNGIQFSGASITAKLGNGLEFSGDSIITKIGTGLEFSGGAVGVKYGTTAGTVAAGDDGRIVNAVQTSQIGSIASRNFSFGTGDPTGGADGDIYFKVT